MQVSVTLVQFPNELVVQRILGLAFIEHEMMMTGRKFSLVHDK